MSHSNIKLTGRIMRRVYSVWVLKRLFSPVAVRVYILAALLWQSTQYVSLKYVFANAPGFESFGANYEFFMYAFSHTERVVPILLTGALAVGVWFAKDFYKDTLFPQRI